MKSGEATVRRGTDNRPRNTQIYREDMAGEDGRMGRVEWEEQEASCAALKVLP